MHIGIDARLYGRSGRGIGRYVQELLFALERNNNNHTYVVVQMRGAEERFQPRDSARFACVETSARWYTLREQWAIPRIFRSAGCDVVHIPHFNVPLLLAVGARKVVNYENKKSVIARSVALAERRSNLTYMSRIAASLHCITLLAMTTFFDFRNAQTKDLIPYVVTIHDLILRDVPSARGSRLPAPLFWLKYMGYRHVLARAVRHAGHIITPTNYVRQRLVDTFGVSEDRVTVTPEGVRLPSLDEEVTLPHGVTAPYIMTVGSAYPHKNIEAVLAALARVRRTRPELTYVFVGKDDFFVQRLKRECAALLRGVVFVHDANDRMLATLYRGAAALVFPSIEEGFGLPGLEALSYGTPVIAGDRASLPEVYGRRALYVNPYDVGEIAWGIMRMQNAEVGMQNGDETPPSPPDLTPALSYKERGATTTDGDDVTPPRPLSKRGGDDGAWDALAEQTVEAYRSVASSK